MPCSAKFSMTLQTEILSIETSNFLKQIFFLRSFYSYVYMIVIVNNYHNHVYIFTYITYDLNQNADGGILLILT